MDGRNKSSPSLAAMGLVAVLLLGVFAPLLLMSPVQMQRVAALEMRMYDVILGPETTDKYADHALDGVREMWPRSATVPSESERGIHQALARRGEVVERYLFLLLLRVAFLQSWHLIAVAFILLAILDGSLLRRARMWDLSFASPLRHRVSMGMLSLSLVALVATLFAPAPLPPVLLPGLILCLGASLQLYLANLAKRR